MAVTRTDSGAPQAALLIDADNLSPLGMEQAVGELHRLGLSLSILRAYGSLETLAAVKAVLQRHGGRGLSNNGPGTTDAALVVDAMDMLHAGQLPSTVAIGSSDGDFAPLALRLREAGMWVICFAQSGKSADADLARCYDQLIAVEAAQPAAEAPPAPTRAARKTPARKKARAAPPPPADPVRELLESIEGFRQGREIAMNEVVKRLRDAGLLAKSATGPAFLRKNAPYVEVSPNYLRLKD